MSDAVTSGFGLSGDQDRAANVDRCIAEIRVRQRRLGTAAEQADDLRKVCELVHRLNNCRAIRVLEHELLRIGRQQRFTLPPLAPAAAI